jgi:tetratricopeptide (TPR) repeat protein
MRRTLILMLFILCGLLSGLVSPELNTARIAYYNNRDYERAKKACLKGIKEGQKNFELYAILAGCEISSGNWQDASAALINAFEVDSSKTFKWMDEKGGGEQNFYQAFYFSAHELFDEQKYEDALRQLDYAKMLNPGEIKIYVLKGAILYKMGKKEEANKQYQKVLGLDSENPDVYFLIGKSLFESKAYDSSSTYFNNATKYYTNDYSRLSRVIFQNLPEVDKNLVPKIMNLWHGQNFKQLDSLIKTELQFNEGLDVHIKKFEQFYRAATDLARSYYFAGMSYYNLKKDSLALKNLLKSIELTPYDLDGLYFMGEIYIKLKKYDDAVPYLKTLTRLKKDDVYAWFYLGVCYTQLKRYKKAIDVYENRVLELDPKNIDAMNNLAFIYSELGENEKSFEYLKKVQEIQNQ